ncbi:DUF368 domain-containing protein [Saccharicrinis fermentans]|uniref:DUF368 domain-containing protein n=1 Tax=Saccharicrinis fermentans DSM 9555 = JCM 21142 TaxID=869213 RepID=W7Y3S7_9BACT|nr:DUF368 domain-containing protein [Saccharicrinis fermentans]GAF02682.1 hypothetical protein JCM21142_31322 [Saccharicrinis fermentans DSM 9555 = JCM 21142]
MNSKSFFQNVLKGMAMGAANVIPGVSGGTIALITGVFERLIDAIKSFDLKALNLLLKGKFTQLFEHIDFWFLFSLFAGIGVAIVSLAQLFKYLFIEYPVYIWAFFFGLVLASIYYVGKTVSKWNISSILTFIIGTSIAVVISVLTPASENSSLLYLFICGIVAICSMIIPGLSGSFVLILMGNYQLIMINAVSELNLKVLLPVAAGAGLGLVGFSHFLSWLLKKFHDQTIAMLTGFIMGSLGILWPWKEIITETFGEKVKTTGYDWHLPAMDTAFFIAVVFIILGIAAIWLTESLGSKVTEKKN